MRDRDVALRAVGLMDLTSLGDNDSAPMIDALCNRARAYQVAAVCVWPQFVTQCAECLAGTSINLATVVNFPGGGTDVDVVVGQTRISVEQGANEIDLVMPYNAWLNGEEGVAANMVYSVKQACDNAKLKVILETGRLRTRQNIIAASRLAIQAGADFIKTSTGKIPVSATPSAASAMLEVISDGHRSVGFKAAGGIRTLRQAGNYLRIADTLLGPGWVTPDHFRFGASSLLDACIPFVQTS
ncbi:MAG: deoxyribose-phosphate aldolase [Gammaproteobacteria bacterium]